MSGLDELSSCDLWRDSPNDPNTRYIDKDYIPNRSDPHTRYRCFRHCNVFYAKTAQDCVEGRFIDPRSLGKAGEELRRRMTDQTVVIYN